MNSRSIKVFPGFDIGDDLLDMFDEMMESISTVSKLPDCLVSGDFPPTNILIDKDENYIIQLAVAGYPEEGVDINFKDDYLTIKLTPTENQFEGYKVKMHGIKSCKAERRILVPTKDFDVTKATASTKNGILSIVIARKPEAKPLNIKVTKE